MLLGHVPEESWFVGWGTLALINAGIAQGKGRSGALWFIGSVFLGPLATLLVVLVDARPASADHTSA